MEPHWTTVAMFWATVVVGLVTVCATTINYLLFRSQTDPEVVVYTKHDTNRATIIMLVVENIGHSVAYDISFSFSKRIPVGAFGWNPIPESDVEYFESGPLSSGIPSLPPGGTREIDWGQYVGLKSVIGEGAIKVTAKFKAKKLLSPEPVYCVTESQIDVESYAGTVATNTNEAKKAREALEKIDKTLGQLGNSISQLGSSRNPIIVQNKEIEDGDS